MAFHKHFSSAWKLLPGEVRWLTSISVCRDPLDVVARIRAGVDQVPQRIVTTDRKIALVWINARLNREVLAADAAPPSCEASEGLVGSLTLIVNNRLRRGWRATRITHPGPSSNLGLEAVFYESSRWNTPSPWHPMMILSFADGSKETWDFIRATCVID
jgi:hypothetical protein